MKTIILTHLKLLQDEKKSLRSFPPHPNEFELRQAVAKTIDEALNELVQEGTIHVNGSTGNKQRILSL